MTAFLVSINLGCAAMGFATGHPYAASLNFAAAFYCATAWWDK